MALTNLGKLDEALNEFSTAVRLRPGVADIHKNLGTLLLNRGRREEAIREFSEVLRITPNDVAARQILEELIKK
jgi:tetratricopeptide (TPR) repeat protein